MNKLVDLHVHTTASDGTMNPAEVVRYAKKRGLAAIAITDHDTVGGLKEALGTGDEIGLEVVPGVEISVNFDREMHILGYYMDLRNRGFQEGLIHLRSNRDLRNPEMILKLQALGMDITMEEVSQVAGDAVVGRPHIAAVMLRKGFVRNSKEAFDKYLGTGKPAYVKRKLPSPRQGIEMILMAGGIAVLAHPKYLLNDLQEMKLLLSELKRYGLAGMEVYYSENTEEETSILLSLARELGLVATGGSDFHGINKPQIEIGTGHGRLQVEYSALKALKDCRK